MAFNNSVGINQEGVVYVGGSGQILGVDGSTAGSVLTSNGPGVAPSFQVNSGSAGASLVEFLPTLQFGNASTGITYLSRTGVGVKTLLTNGSVFVYSFQYQIQIRLTSKGTATNTAVATVLLPFVTNPSSYIAAAFGAIPYMTLFSIPGTVYAICSLTVPGTNLMQLTYTTENQPQKSLQFSHFSNTTQFVLTGTLYLPYP